MRKMRLIEALGNVKEEYIEEASPLNADVNIKSLDNIKRSARFGSKKWIILIAAAILAIGVLSVGAATDFKWFPAIRWEYRVDEDAMKVYEKYGMNNVVGQCVTQKGVTVAVEEYISDRHMLYVIVSVDGIKDPKRDADLTFENVSMTVGNDGGFSMIYLGKDTSSGKHLFRLKSDNFGSSNDIAGQYYFEERDITGQMVRIVIDGIEEISDIEHVAENGVPYLEEQVNETYEGVFEFSWEIENTAPTYVYDCEGVDVANEGIHVTSITLSPMSMTVKAEYTQEALKHEWVYSGFYGFKMKDGSLIESYNLDSEKNLGSNIIVDGFIHSEIVDLEQVEALVFIDPFREGGYVPIEHHKKVVEIPLSMLR